MIKGRPPFPFETIALAVAFTPRLEALIAETKRLATLFNARTIFIHAGKCTSEKEGRLEVLLRQYGFDETGYTMQWQDGEVVESILSVCKNNVVDLLIIGALEKENRLRYYMGSLSREISRRAKCSVLMLTEPRLNPIPFRRMVINGHEHSKTSHTIETGFYLARKEKNCEVVVVDEIDVPEVSIDRAEGNFETAAEAIPPPDKMATIQDRFSHVDQSGLQLKIRTFAGRQGGTISQFAQQINADLLVVNSPDHHMTIFDRIFSHDLEYMLADLPCNMLIVHSRVF